MSVAAEDQFEVSMRRLAVNFRSMRKQDGKFVVRNIGRRILNIICPEVMRVIDAGEMNALAVDGDYFDSFSSIRIPISSRAGSIRIVS